MNSEKQPGEQQPSSVVSDLKKLPTLFGSRNTNSPSSGASPFGGTKKPSGKDDSRVTTSPTVVVPKKLSEVRQNGQANCNIIHASGDAASVDNAAEEHDNDFKAAIDEDLPSSADRWTDDSDKENSIISECSSIATIPDPEERDSLPPTQKATSDERAVSPKATPLSSKSKSRLCHSALGQVDVHVLDELNRSFASIYADASRRMSSTSMPNISTSPGSPKELEISKPKSPPPPTLESILQRAREGKLHVESPEPAEPNGAFPIAAGNRSPLSEIYGGDLLARARQIVGNVAVLKEELKPSNVVDMVKKYFPEPMTSMADLSILPDEIVTLVNSCPHLFLVECEVPNQIQVRLRCQPTPEKLAIKSVRRAIEHDLEWLNKAETIIDRYTQSLVCVAPICFVPPRAFLFCAFWGNDRGERFCEIQNMIAPYIDELVPVTEIRPGMACIVREGHDYARAVVVEEASEGMVMVVFMDIYESSEASISNLFEMPEELSSRKISSSLYLSRLRGLQTVALESQNDLAQLIDTQRTNKCVAGVVLPATDDDICLTDIVLAGTQTWLSEDVIAKFDVIPDLDHPEFNAVEVNQTIVNYYEAGTYQYTSDFDAIRASSTEDAAQEEETAEESSQEENVAPVQPRLVNVVANGRQISYFDHINSYAAFVEATLARVGTKPTARMCTIYDALSQATFLMSNGALDNNEMNAIEGLVARLKAMI